MRLDGIGAECIDAPGDPVVKPRTDIDQQVTAMHGQVGLIQPVHPQHAHPVRSRRRIAAQPHQGGGDGKTCCIHQFAQKLAGCRAGVDDAATCVEHWLLGGFHRLNQFGDGGDVALHARLVMAGRGFRRRIGASGELHVLWNVDQHRARPPAGGNVEGFMDGAGQRICVFHQPVMFGAGAGDANGVGLLKRVRTDHEGRHLAG